MTTKRQPDGQPEKPRIVDELPRLGSAGSRSAQLHEQVGGTGVDPKQVKRISVREMNRFSVLRLLGTVGALLIGLGGLGAGALPVVHNPFGLLPGGSLMARMLQASSAVVLIGVALMVVAWVLMAPFVGAKKLNSGVTDSTIMRTFLAWSLPLLFTAPLFTQDIYSYLAQGSIVAQGLDPYSAGPVNILGTEHHLARSVPFIWAHSPSPYGPVALGIAAAISVITQDSIILGVLAHRFVSLVCLLGASWAIAALARRCDVAPATALWLGILNPLTILHLVGGIHNESILLGFMLIGVEVGLRGIDKLETASKIPAWSFIIFSGVLITCAGLVKVTGFMALGFTGMAVARAIGGWKGLIQAVLVQVSLLVSTTAVVSWITGIGLGWVTGQGGAATIRSWLSVSTDIGVIFGFIGMLLGLGDHTDALLAVTRLVGVLIAIAFLLRMLWATYKGSIHPVGGLGVATFVLVILFPVVHPWYMLWAILPLAAWANRPFFRQAVVAYSAVFSFLVLPRGLALPASTVLTIYSSAIVAGIVLATLAILWLRTNRVHQLT
ncbi:polyprenol phosphomannose-dependent alpha 1,6 mannosyltransferase MptB [Corynebacterium breve]|uniref:Polyprenol phosphomannose-dependent alpha 1,6 mannosyltransferase MptB n=1 Tax=Corynebacterium breve TaxID=3049799 RepID=A0ABY8VIJ8_9CORY|nr:polyprenol phosphomannose-dependent alpha 1,6 mannosyltransferase MptB [Corynebacterium breve]WIM68882.1 polyprenol phosphomannose-dependent alpha 1,6 mannosyltransferase MptB [Corynebacterium breve]